MKFSNLIKKIMPLFLGIILLLGVMNFNYLDSQKTLPSFGPAFAMAQVPGLQTCNIDADVDEVLIGGSITISWQTEGFSQVTINGQVVLPTSAGTITFNNIQQNTTYTLIATTQDGNSSCTVSITIVCITPVLPPTCTLTPVSATVSPGEAVNLVWTTTNAASATLTSFGNVALSGNQSTGALTTSTNYTLAVLGQNGTTVNCISNITVSQTPLAPVCNSFTALPLVITSGGTSTLAWTTTNATTIVINNAIGQVAASGSIQVSPLLSTQYTMTVFGTNNQSVSCQVNVIVNDIPVVPLPTCNSFTATPATLPLGGGNVNLAWTTSNATAVSISPNLVATAVSGNTTAVVTTSTTFILTVVGLNNQSTSCPVTVTVETGGGGGGGGGGSSSPRCEISLSKNKIDRGDSATLRWDTTRASDIEIVDSKNRVIVTTKGLSGNEKSNLLDGSIKVSPTADTKYTLTAKRGSREKVCVVAIDVENPVVVTEVRDQQPLIAGISLSEVPYTGFEAGPLLTFSFYVLLLAWALYIAYVLVIRRDVFGGYALASSHIVAETPTPEEIRPDVFVKSVSTIQRPIVNMVPSGLPVADKVIGYDALVQAAQATEEVINKVTISSNDSSATDEVVTALENYAHAKKSLLSSDAIRHFVGTTSNQEERFAILNDVIMTAKEKYPAEDGWVVINEKRMRDLCVTCSVNEVPSDVAPYVPTIIPEGSGSLAEAIVSGNIVAAYEMIGHRPMFALADAASDLDSVYRGRKGEKMVISDLLLESTAKLSDEQIMQMIKALTGALDGIYNDEESAVKMAIMKAVKVVA